MTVLSSMDVSEIPVQVPVEPREASAYPREQAEEILLSLQSLKHQARRAVLDNQGLAESYRRYAKYEAYKSQRLLYDDLAGIYATQTVYHETVFSQVQDLEKKILQVFGNPEQQ